MSRGFPEEFRQELLNRTDIVDIISRYVDLKRKGGKYWGCCPFHNEKTASFNVDINKQFFYCFGCRKGGDAITFIKEIEHLGYVEAVEYLADKAGIPIPALGDSKVDEERQRERKRHYEIMKLAAGYYYSMLTGSNKAMQYCSKRGITPNIAKRFGMGYAPPDGKSLIRYMESKGCSLDELYKSGLVRKSDKGYFDFFFDRLMFPIMDVYGNVIAFGGRVLGDGLPKYLNSSDSPLYNKKRHLYGLNIAKKNKQTDRLVLVEGYMDVVTVSSFGIGGAVASLGTALTKEQCMLIKRFTKDVYIAYDGDNAGRKAAVRAAGLLVDEGIMPRILVFKDGLDPDEFLKKYGVDEFETLISRAVLPFRFEIDLLAEDYDLSAEAGRRDFGAEAIKIAAGIKNELDKEDILKYLAVKTGYSVDALSRQGVKLYKMEENSHNITKPTIVPKKDSFRIKAEGLALKLALNGKRDEILLGLGEGDFSEPVYKECYRAIKEGLETESQLVAMFNEQEKTNDIMGIIVISDEVVEKTSAQACISAIKNEQMKDELEKYQRMLEAKDIDKEQRLLLLTKITELQKQLKQN